PSGFTDAAAIDSSGNFLIGGTLPSAPNIQLKADGSAAFVGSLACNINGGMISINGSGGNNLIQCSTGNRAVALGMWAGGEARWYSTGGMKFGINATANNGSAPSGFTDAAAIDSSGNFLIGDTLPSAPNITLGSNGVAQAKGGFIAKQDSGYFFVGQTSSNANKVLLNSDGSAEFASGNVKLYANGLVASSATSPNAYVFSATTGTISGSNPAKAIITAGGSAEFAGDITCTDNSKGLILKSPDGTSFRLSVANDGTLSASSI
ncbi:MAG: hypothetical protein GY918_09490, partial [Gammaproteobacteria bacterium]|nr:hypothetical protein [Gammaproteobacteria bacterium]